MDRIVRGYILPKAGNVHVEEISYIEGEEMLRKYEEVLSNIISSFLNTRKIDKIRSGEELYDLLNEIVVTIRWTLYLDPIPKVIPSPAFLIIYLIRNKNLKLFSKDTISGLHETPVIEDALKRSVEYERLREYVMDILRYPADTRYGANTSSLLIHMITTSAIASCLLLSRFKDVKDIQNMLIILRLISLFHDVGKFNMREWHRHEDKSMEFMDKVFSEYVDGDAKKLIDDAKKIMRENTGTIMDIFREADRISSNIDRLVRYIPDMLSEKVKAELIECAGKYGRSVEDAYRDWKFWDFVGYEMIKKLTEDFCRNASRIDSRNPIIRAEVELKEDWKELKEILVTRFDVRGIQNYIRVNDLRSICGASRIVDFTCLVSIPCFIINNLKLPAECILYFGGGSITVVTPPDKVSEFSKLCSEAKRELGLNIIYGSSYFHSSFSIVNYNIDCELMRRKILEDEELNVEPNISYICDFCGSSRVEVLDGNREKVGDSLVCRACRVKYDVGDSIYLNWRIRRVKSLLSLNVDLDKLKKYVMEYIAGVKYESIEREYIERYPNIALIRFDANLASLIMMSCTSISDAVERSIRIDYSVKKALHDVIDYVRNKYAEEYFRLILGIIYVGGDDGFMLCPSYIALPLTIHLAREFNIQMGGKATLSIGIAVAKPKHPILELYRSAGYLLDKYAKGSARGESVKIAGGSDHKFYGSLAFYVADGGVMTEHVLDHVIDLVGSKRLSLMYDEMGKIGSYMISSIQEDNSIFRLLSIVFGDIDIETFNYRGLMDMIINSINEKQRSGESDLHNRLTDIRNDALDIVKKTLFTDDSVKVKIIYAKRQSKRLGHRYIDILKYLFSLKEMRFPLHDLLQIVKIVGGGIE
ncbi:MAG: hypothetical protein QW534_05335 [Candidatus Methanomethylicia archaeon]